MSGNTRRKNKQKCSKCGREFFWTKHLLGHLERGCWPKKENPIWNGRLRHSRELCDDWGCIRDEAGNMVIRVSLPTHDENVLNEHRKNKTDPTQERVDFILLALNGKTGGEK